MLADNNFSDYITERMSDSHERVVLTNEIIRLKSSLVAGDFSISPEICELENRLKELISKELTGVLLRCKARWLEEGEKPTRFFLISNPQFNI